MLCSLPRAYGTGGAVGVTIADVADNLALDYALNSGCCLAAVTSLNSCFCTVAAYLGKPGYTTLAEQAVSLATTTDFDTLAALLTNNVAATEDAFIPQALVKTSPTAVRIALIEVEPR